MAATVEESTPPDMATATVWSLVSKNCASIRFSYSPRESLCSRTDSSLVHRAQFAQASDDFGNPLEREVNIIRRVLLAEAEAKACPGAIRRESHRSQHVRRLNCAR